MIDTTAYPSVVRRRKGREAENEGQCVYVDFYDRSSPRSEDTTSYGRRAYLFSAANGKGAPEAKWRCQGEIEGVSVATEPLSLSREEKEMSRER